VPAEDANETSAKLQKSVEEIAALEVQIRLMWARIVRLEAHVEASDCVQAMLASQLGYDKAGMLDLMRKTQNDVHQKFLEEIEREDPSAAAWLDRRPLDGGSAGLEDDLPKSQ